MHSPAMSTRILLILGFSLATLHAADPSPEDLLRHGLFEEEANQNLDKAAEHYRAVIAAHDRQRALAASATFRLGEVARKKNEKESAAAAFRAVTERFPEQAELARLSRENLAALGIEISAPSAPAATDPEDAEIARLKEIARNSPDLIDGAGLDGWRPIHHAAANGWTRVISYLLENKVASNCRTNNEVLTPLQLASIHGHLATVKTLLAAKVDLNIQSPVAMDGGKGFPSLDSKAKEIIGTWTALEMAILYDRPEITRTLIEAGADLDHVGLDVLVSQGRLPISTLEMAIYLGRNKLAQTFITAGASLAATGEKDWITPLGMAVGYNQDMIAPLLKAGADPKSTDLIDRITPLHRAAGFGRIEAAQLLIEAGADAKATNAKGETPLHWTFKAEIAEFLIAKGADPNAKDSAGLTTLDRVAAQNEVDSNAALIEVLLKHGATVADPRALLRRTSEAMLPFVGERLVYPKLHNTDAILLSVRGDHFFNQEPAPSGGARRPRVRSQQESRPEVIALETRASPASPPPSLAEVMRMAFGQSGYPQSIRIIRRGENDRIDIIREWCESGGNKLPTDWPALVWGDVVEVRSSSGRSGDASSFGDFAAMIPARAVTFRLGELEFPKTIPGEETFWLDSNASETLPSLLPPNIQSVADQTRFVVRRKGLPAPITLDFSKPTDARFRLLDGDTVEMSWDVPKLYKQFESGQSNHVLALTKDGGGSGSYLPNSLVELLSQSSINGPIDFSKVCILRRAENWKPEMFDLKAWIEQLPPREKWERDALLSSAPKLNPGDAVIVIDNPAADAEKTAAEIRKKAGEAATVMSVMRARERVVPPAAPR